MLKCLSTWLVLSGVSALSLACSSDGSDGPTAGGAPVSGGSTSSAGSSAIGGSSTGGIGGSIASGGAAASSGASDAGGTAGAQTAGAAGQAQGGMSSGGAGGAPAAGAAGQAGAGQGGSTDSGKPLTAGEFYCVNWADSRDNYVNGLLQLSQLSTSDNYATVLAKSNAVLSGFQTLLKANSIRIPINEPTVSGAWWNAYKGVIDAAISKKMSVIIAYWAHQNGKPDSMTEYDAMWKKVIDTYQSSSYVFFEMFNEPYGYSNSEWATFAENWVSKYSTVPKNRIVVAGVKYDNDVTSLGKDSKLDGTLLSLHAYQFFSSSTNTTTGWQDYIKSKVGSYGSRTIATEWGGPQTEGCSRGVCTPTGVSYDKVVEGNAFSTYFTGVPNQLRTLRMGSCYWPGLRSGDWYSMTTASGSGSNLTLKVVNPSGLARLQWAWGM